jgi:hypothetical protein
VFSDPLLKEAHDIGFDTFGLVVSSSIVARFVGQKPLLLLLLHGRILDTLQHLRSNTCVVAYMQATEHRQLAVG